MRSDGGDLTPKLEDHLRDAIRAKHYSRHTADAYAMWYRQFVIFHGKRHPAEMGEVEISAFLQHLCVTRNVAAATHNQVMAGIGRPNGIRPNGVGGGSAGGARWHHASVCVCGEVTEVGVKLGVVLGLSRC
jgi:hypothetical protein